MTTAELTASALEILTLAGCTVWRQNAGKARRNIRLAPAGTPDIIGYAQDGTFIGVEIKGPGDKLSNEQLEWMGRASYHGCHVMVVENAADLERLANAWK